MYLKSIKAYGFKSFADKIEINFNENINGIVGPNGSGKSNVVDAVRWVLGEQSIKSLRGESSTDIIFSGSKSRKPLNSASVTLVFDNSDNYLPLNFNEVSIKRLMYKSGENEYYINNERCRLKDINDLLTDSGAGRDSFNIISQGKIDEILSTKATDRRGIFESAAGVLKYKKRKEDALKKLDRTDDNLNRVNDIISELETSLRPLERQSKEALEYLEYKDKLDNVSIGVIVRDITDYNNRINEIKGLLDVINNEVVITSNEINNTDIKLSKSKEELKKLEDNINNKQTMLLELTRNIEKTSADIRVLEERRKYSSDSDKINDNIINIKKELMEVESEANRLGNLINDKVSNYSSICKREEELDTKYKSLKDREVNVNNSINLNNREIANLNYRIDYLKNNIKSNDSLPNSIKSIMDNPRLKGVHNVIGKLITVSDEYKTSIYTALGSSNNYLVVDNRECAKEMINYLRDNKLGRATFYPMDVIKERYVLEVDLDKVKNIDGYIDVASNLVSYDNKYKNIIMNRLGNNIITRDLDSANNISKVLNNKYKIITLDGQEVNVGGSITGGSSYNNGILKYKNELDSNEKKLIGIKEKNTLFDKEINDIYKELSIVDRDIHDNKVLKEEVSNSINKLRSDIEALNDKKELLDREYNDLSSIISNNSRSEEDNLLNSYYNYIKSRDNISNEINNLNNKKSLINDNIVELDSLNRRVSSSYNDKVKELKKLEVEENSLNIRLDNLLLELGEEYNLTYDGARDKYHLDMDIDEAREMVSSIKNKLKNFGDVYLGATSEYERVKERYDFLIKQRDDLYNARGTLFEIINEMDSIMKEKFTSTFEAIRVEFKKVFKEMFGGGEAELVLSDPDNILETGIEIQAVPSGKNLKSLSLLSGGEKTFTAISLLFAILNVRPVPFCLLDEVEAALDDANVEAFGNYLNKYKDKTQFILITHKKKTMEFADILYGITMQESGVSKLVSVKLENIENK